MKCERSLTHRSRGRLLRATLGVALIGVAACSSSESEPQDGGAAGSGFPIAIDHVYGTTEIPDEPERIVTLGLSDHDPLLALGVKPIAVSEWYGEYPHATWPWATDELGSAEPVVLNGGERDEANPPMEEIASLEPDLILSLYNGTTEEQYDQLSEIAPTVLPAEEFADFEITWEEATRLTGQALGRESEARKLIANLKDRFATVAAKHPGFDGQEVVVAERFEPGSTVVRTGNDMRARFFEQLGFDVPDDFADIEPDKFGEITVSDELMTELSQDLLIWNIGFSPEIREQLEQDPVYQTLPVVDDDRVLWVEDPELSGAFTWGTVLSLDYALDAMVPKLEAILD